MGENKPPAGALFDVGAMLGVSAEAPKRNPTELVTGEPVGAPAPLGNPLLNEGDISWGEPTDRTLDAEETEDSRPGWTARGTDNDAQSQRDLADRDELGEDLASLVGTTLHGHQLLAEVGVGVSSRVYRAEHVHLHRVHAIKVIRPSFAASETLRRRVSFEAQALMEVRHPNLVSVYDFGVTDRGQPFLVMEYLEGRSLAQILKRNDVVPLARAMDIVRQIAQGLAALHRAGLVHRDLKPANVMLVEREGKEVAKILDLGLARLIERGDVTQLTSARDMLGSPAYMSPEQIRTPLEVGPEADLYALGVMMYRMFTGNLPFQGSLEKLFDQHLNREAPRLPSSIPYSAIVERLLSKERARRPRSASELLLLLDSTDAPLEANTTPAEGSTQTGTAEQPASQVTTPRLETPSLTVSGEVDPTAVRTDDPRRFLRTGVFVLVLMMVGMAIGIATWPRNAALDSGAVEVSEAEPVVPLRRLPAPVALIATPLPLAEVEEVEAEELPGDLPSMGSAGRSDRTRKSSAKTPTPRQRLRRELARRFLLDEDLSKLLPGRSLDPPPAEAELVIEELRRVEISADFLRGRLDRILRVLQHLDQRGRGSPDLEGRYLELRKRLRNGMDQAASETLNRDAHALEIDVGRARS